MRRRLLLTNESARHPLRKRMPPQALAVSPQSEPLTDLAFFGASFLSCFIIIMGMIA